MRCNRCFLFALAFVLLGLALPAARAQTAPRETVSGTRKAAEGHFKIGKAQLDAGNYDEAITEFRAAFTLSGAENAYFFLGEALRLKGSKQEALDNYQKYVAAKPDGSKATEAVQHIAELTRELKEAKAAADGKAAPQTTGMRSAVVDKAVKAPPQLEPALDAEPSIASAPVPPSLVSDSSVAQPRPTGRRKVAIISGVVGGVVVIGVGLGLGLGLGLQGDGIPSTSLGAVDFRQ